MSKVRCDKKENYVDIYLKKFGTLNVIIFKNNEHFYKFVFFFFYKSPKFNKRVRVYLANYCLLLLVIFRIKLYVLWLQRSMLE